MCVCIDTKNEFLSTLLNLKANTLLYFSQELGQHDGIMCLIHGINYCKGKQTQTMKYSHRHPLLPPPNCEDFIFIFVGLLLRWIELLAASQKTDGWILMKLSESVKHDTVNNLKHFEDPTFDALDTWLCSRFLGDRFMSATLREKRMSEFSWNWQGGSGMAYCTTREIFGCSRPQTGYLSVFPEWNLCVRHSCCISNMNGFS